MRCRAGRTAVDAKIGATNQPPAVNEEQWKKVEKDRK
jgi:hypothetical protein